MGGVPIKQDIEMLKKNPPTIIVGTPGRILELIQKKYLDVKKLKHFILDECDKLLEEQGNQLGDNRH
jgi:ATP-dependent RNA helicase UAP56/SUB2